MPPKNPENNAELLNFILAGQLDYRASQQRRLPRELAQRYPKLGAKDLARRTEECRAATTEGAKRARQFVAADMGYQYRRPGEDKGRVASG